MTVESEPNADFHRSGGHPKNDAIAQPANAFLPFEKIQIEQAISDRFEQIVHRYQNRVAVKTTRESLTYSQLNRLANQIAHAILAKCGERNEPVVLFFEHGTLLIAAILGTLKAGKIYVSLDPLHPPSLNKEALLDSTAKLILTDTLNIIAANKLTTQRIGVLNIDNDKSNISAENPQLDIAPDQLAYIFYTSGTTGNPKGVMDTHRNVLHNIMRYTNNLHISTDDHLTLLQSCSFSGSVSSLFCALLNGATCFPFSLQQDGPDLLASWVNRERISIYHSVPSIFRLIATGDYEYPYLRIIRLEGDQTSPRDLKLYKIFFPDTCILVNGLGATECGIVRQYFVNKKTPIPDSVVPIGYAVEDVEILLMDESKKQLGVNCVGEIAVRSLFLSPGYWRRPELTEAAFWANPKSGDKLTYRTGDLGRMLPDGCLLYLGRKDFQVKIRGYRVELAEVEKALLDLVNMQEAVVVDGDDSLGEKRLIAYLVCDIHRPVSVSRLRSSLSQKLPEYMIPSTFVILDALPLTPNGKIDRRALPKPDNSRPELDNAFIPAHTPIEQTLSEIWSEVLNINSVGIRDKFLELGGNSLMAMQVITRVLKTFHLKLSLKSLFEAPTVSEMAAVIVQNLSKKMEKEELEQLLSDLEKLSNNEANDLAKLI